MSWSGSARWRDEASGGNEIKTWDRRTKRTSEERYEVRGEGRSAWFGASLALAAVVGLATLVWRFLHRAHAVQAINEDSFISLRYARNLLAGDGLVFNPGGERVEGITNLLWTLLLAGVSGVSDIPLPEASVKVGMLCGALVLAVALIWGYEELSRVTGHGLPALAAAFVAPVLIAFAPGFAFYSGSGLEVALFALLLTAGLYGVSRGGASWSVGIGSFLLGLATMTRPEGALVLGLAALASVGIARRGREDGDEGERKRLSVRFHRFLVAAVPGGLVVLAFTGWRIYYYGEILPNTAYAKAGGMEVVERWGIPYLLGAVQGNWFVIGYLAILGGAFLSRAFRWRSLAVLAIVPLWCAYLVYAGGDYMPFHRLLLPIVPTIYILAVAGFAWIASRMTFALSSVAKVAVVATLGVALVLPLVAEMPEQFETEKMRQEGYLKDNENRKEVADWFRENDPNALIARNGVGVIGYYTDLRIIDMLGLNNEHIAKHGSKDPTDYPGHQSSDAEYVLSRNPEYIMVADLKPKFSFAGDRELVQSKELKERYELVRLELESGREIVTYRLKEQDRT